MEKKSKFPEAGRARFGQQSRKFGVTSKTFHTSFSIVLKILDVTLLMNPENHGLEIALKNREQRGATILDSSASGLIPAASPVFANQVSLSEFVD